MQGPGRVHRGAMPRRQRLNPLAGLSRDEQERELEHAAGRLYFDVRGREFRGEVDRAVRAPIEKAAKAALTAIKAGTLRGTRA